MKVRSRFIKAVIKSAQDDSIEMPWKRGARRAAFIARRIEIQGQLKRA